MNHPCPAQVAEQVANAPEVVAALRAAGLRRYLGALVDDTPLKGRRRRPLARRWGSLLRELARRARDGLRRLVRSVRRRFSAAAGDGKVHVALFSDRPRPAAATLASVCASGDPANLVFHVVFPSTDAALDVRGALGGVCDGATFAFRSLAEATRTVAERFDGPPAWESFDVDEPEGDYALDRHPKHASPYNHLRFYAPALAEYDDVAELVLLDDDVVVRDGARARPAGAPLAAGCVNWVPATGGLAVDLEQGVLDVPHLGYAVADGVPARLLARLRKAAKAVGARWAGDPERELRTWKAWNFGYSVVDVAAWRRRDVTGSYLRWVAASRAEDLFPAGSLAHGLGLAYLALGDDVSCLEASGALVLQGLGYLGRADVNDTLLASAAALHFNGDVKPWTGQEKGATFPTSKAPLSADFHSFRLIFGRAIISRNGLEAWMLFPERARAEHSR